MNRKKWISVICLELSILFILFEVLVISQDETQNNTLIEKSNKFKQILEEHEKNIYKNWGKYLKKYNSIDKKFRKYLSDNPNKKKKFFELIVHANEIAMGKREEVKQTQWGSMIFLSMIPADIYLQAVVPETKKGGRLHGWFEELREQEDELLLRLENTFKKENKIKDFYNYRVTIDKFGSKTPDPFIHHVIVRSTKKGIHILFDHLTKKTSNYGKYHYKVQIVNHYLWASKRQVDSAVERSEINNYLKELSKSKIWWVRLFVAETMRQHPDLRADQILEYLSKDNHNIVSEIGSSIWKNDNSE